MMESSERVSELLQEISDSQRKLLEQNEESLQLQKQQLQLMLRLMDKPSTDDDNWETGRLSRRGSAMMDKTRNLFLIILCLLVILLVFASWALFA
jgi:ABC-type phosphate transport system auxiliary subunit